LVFWADSIDRTVFIGYSADAENLASANTDSNDTNNGIAREPVQPSQMSNATL
jgi:hypothetical protein